jgi:hypothetical protein
MKSKKYENKNENLCFERSFSFLLRCFEVFKLFSSGLYVFFEKETGLYKYKRLSARLYFVEVGIEETLINKLIDLGLISFEVDGSGFLVCLTDKGFSLFGYRKFFRPFFYIKTIKSIKSSILKINELNNRKNYIQNVFEFKKNGHKS